MTWRGEEVERVPNWGGNVVTGSGKANGMMPVLRLRLKTTQMYLYKIPSQKYILHQPMRKTSMLKKRNVALFEGNKRYQDKNKGKVQGYRNSGLTIG